MHSWKNENKLDQLSSHNSHDTLKRIHPKDATLRNRDIDTVLELTLKDFEIVCPYCNHEFVSDIGSDIKEVECPECHNTIELDWNQEGEDECGGHCGTCGGCEHEEEVEEIEVVTDEIEEDNEEDDDM